MTQIVLERFPVALFGAMDEAAEGLFREYLMVAFSGGHAFSADDVGMAAEAKQVLVSALEDRGGWTDLRLDLTATHGAQFSLLQAVLEHANLLARSGQLLALPVLPEIAALRNWICDQVVTQLSGAASSPWQLPENPEAPGIPPATWSGLASLPQDEAWLVGDDANRIIGASDAALALLQWPTLVGERILAVVPPDLREQHIAAFSRGVVTGDYHLMDRPLPLAALTASGESVPVTMTLSRHAAVGERTVYLARLVRR